MKKLYHKGAVHPSPPLISDHLAFLPATILTLAAALSQEDREVLAYLISCSSGSFSGKRKGTQKTTGGGKGGDHPPSFSCNCFGCYTSYWVRWDSSPNRQLIHEIIDALEDELARGKKEKNKREKRKKGASSTASDDLKPSELSLSKDESRASESVDTIAVGCASGGGGEACGGSGEDGGEEEVIGKGSVRRLASFIGEKIWGVWT